MTLQAIYDDAIRPALGLLPIRMTSKRAIYWMLAIHLQEDPDCRRVQVMPAGSTMEPPARGLWQFEQGGGVRGVLFHPRTGELAMKVCQERGLVKPLEPRAVWLRLAEDDVLAAAFARLLLWSDGYPLPPIGDEDAGWAMYCDRLWRPGRPHHERWPANCLRAEEFVAGLGVPL